MPNVSRCGALLLTLVLPATGQTPRPNVVVILADDQGWGDLHCHGNEDLSTPNIDGLAAAGASFDRFYVCPVCSPTRAEFLTGRYHARSGVYSTSAGGERIDLDEKTIADTFRAAGYATAAFGKWHNGMQYPYHPNARGFDEFYGFCSGHWGDYFSPPLEHNGEPVRGNGFVTDDFTERAMAFIERRRDRPFLVYLAFNTPHSPMQVPDRWWRKYAGKKVMARTRAPIKKSDNHARAALAMCENIDWNVGRLLSKLDELALDDNTIVVYFSDNGPNGWRYNGGMRGRKGSTDEGGVRSPLFIRWPGHIRAGRKIEPLGAAIDLLPTVCDLVGIPIVGDKPIDGVSLAPLLNGNNDGWPSRVIFSHWRGRVSARTQTYRLDHKQRLYDMTADPGQLHDVAAARPKVALRLQKAVADWRSAVLPKTRPVRPFPVGHADCKVTQLPARDAATRGSIKRSNRHPNCSFFTNWVHTDDRITWPVEVLESGDYAVELYYTCPEPDVGAVIELAFRGETVRGRVTAAHDPPLRGMKQDRVRRVESYVKDFKVLQLGRIKLSEDVGELSLRAVKIPGRTAMDFRLLILRH